MENQSLISPTYNKYLKWYWNIIENAKNRVLADNIYIEKHHPFPKSIYGQGETVKLTAKEHYIAHLTLWWGLREKYGTKNDNTIKMCYAFSMMGLTNTDNRKIKGSKEYSFLRQALAERGHTMETRKKLSKIMSTPKYKKIASKTHKGKIVSEETRQKLSESHKDQKPSEEHKENLRKKFKGEGHPQYGTKHSEETKQKLREAWKKRKERPEGDGIKRGKKQS